MHDKHLGKGHWVPVLSLLDTPANNNLDNELVTTIQVHVHGTTWNVAFSLWNTMCIVKIEIIAPNDMGVTMDTEDCMYIR